jgi:MFS family permease
MGFAQIFFMASCNTTVQVTAPDHLRGRVMSLYAMVFVGVHPFGALLAGGLAEKWGVGAACVWGGVMGLCLVLALTLLWRRRHVTGVPG